MKLFKTYTFLIACLLSISGYSQQKKNAVAKKPIITKKNVVINEANGYAITLNTKNLQNEKITFYMLYGTAKKQIVNDSITIKSNDQIVNFKFDKKIIGAIYFLKIESQPKTIELAIDNNTTATFSGSYLDTISSALYGFLTLNVLSPNPKTSMIAFFSIKLNGDLPGSVLSDVAI
jgi:hypothetical protein